MFAKLLAVILGCVSFWAYSTTAQSAESLANVAVVRDNVSAGETTSLASIQTTSLGIPVVPPAPSITILADEIDRLIEATWKTDGPQPAPPADDAEFVRRVFLDVVGRIPTRDEFREFLADNRREKRSSLVEELVASPEFAVHFANQWNAHLLGRTTFPAPEPWLGWLRSSFESHSSWRQMCREMLTAIPLGTAAADQPVTAHGPSEFLVRRLSSSQALDEVTRDVTRLLFGVDMQCARCHTHPEVGEWETSSYWGMAAFFNRSYVVEIDGHKFVAERARGEATYTDVESKETQTAMPRFMTGAVPSPEPALTEEPAELVAERKARFPEAKPDSPLLDNPDDYATPPAEKPRTPSQPKYSRRAALVELALDEDNPYFARAVVNRVWAWLLGQGLIEPLDQLHSANPATHPEVLEALCRDFVAHDYDVKRLVAAISRSKIYQRSSVRHSSGESLSGAGAYLQGSLKALSSRQLACATLCALGYAGALGGERAEFEDVYAEQLADLTKRFDTGSDEFQPGVSLALYLANNPTFAELIANAPLICELASLADDEDCIASIYESLLSRAPDADELAVMKSYLAARSKRRTQALEQVVWSLVSSSEFRFNH